MAVWRLERPVLYVCALVTADSILCAPDGSHIHSKGIYSPDSQTHYCPAVQDFYT